MESCVVLLTCGCKVCIVCMERFTESKTPPSILQHVYPPLSVPITPCKGSNARMDHSTMDHGGMDMGGDQCSMNVRPSKPLLVLVP
jgi:hypothetical protein